MLWIVPLLVIDIVKFHLGYQIGIHVSMYYIPSYRCLYLLPRCYLSDFNTSVACGSSTFGIEMEIQLHMHKMGAYVIWNGAYD